MYTVRLYGHDEAAGREALLQEHTFTDLGEARECERRLVRSGTGLVTFNDDVPARTRVRDAELRVFSAEPGTDDASDMYVMEVLGVTVRVRLVADEDGGPAGPDITVDAGGRFAVSVNDDRHYYNS